MLTRLRVQFCYAEQAMLYCKNPITMYFLLSPIHGNFAVTKVENFRGISSKDLKTDLIIGRVVYKRQSAVKLQRLLL